MGAENKIQLDCLVRRTVEEVMSQREEILRAFIAKYGFEPDQAIQIEQKMPDGTTHWFIRRMTDEEMSAIRESHANTKV